MSSIFSTLKKYKGQYTPVSDVCIDSEDLQVIKPYADVVTSNYGKKKMSVCFYTIEGNFTEYIPVSTTDYQLRVGDRVDCKDLHIVTLKKDEDVIQRVYKK